MRVALPLFYWYTTPSQQGGVRVGGSATVVTHTAARRRTGGGIPPRVVVLPRPPVSVRVLATGGVCFFGGATVATHHVTRGVVHLTELAGARLTGTAFVRTLSVQVAHATAHAQVTIAGAADMRTATPFRTHRARSLALLRALEQLDAIDDLAA